jgi:putative Mg2+ transporter-C (MgtC) family protein
MLDAVFLTGLLVAINSALRPLARYLDRRSLAVMDTQTLYRLRLSCESEHQEEVEHRLTHALASRSLALREIRAERVEDTDSSLIQAILESTTRDATVMRALAAKLRTDPWAQSVEWTEASTEA